MQPQPNRHVDFDPGLGLLNSVDKYDRMEKEYYDKTLNENSSRAFELSQIKEISDTKNQTIPYRHLVTLVQSKESTNEIKKTLLKTGDIKKLNKFENGNLKSRVKCIKRWLNNHAPESVKFEIQEKAPDIKFNNEDLNRIKHLKEKIESIDWNPEAIHDSFYELQENHDTAANEYFRIMYLIILGKERGPRLGFFLSTMKQKFVVERLTSY